MKLLRLMVKEGMHLHKILYLTFVLQHEMLPRLYPLHHAAYAVTKFKVAAVNGLGGGTLPRNCTLERTYTRMDRRTDRPRRINVPFFSPRKSG